jgi:predicted small lipoprotein YifL
MPGPVRTGRTAAVTVILALAAMLSLTACGSAAGPVSGPHPDVVRAPASAVPGPPAGSRAEAAALAGQILSGLSLPPGARPVPSALLPPALSAPAYSYPSDAAYVDQYQAYAVAEPVDSVVAALSAHVPAGMRGPGTGAGGGPGGSWFQEVDYTDWSLPAGIAGAELLFTVTSVWPGTSTLRADAMVRWYPPRTAAEYVDPARYHVLTIAVTVYGRTVRTLRAIVMSPSVIARLAGTLNRSQADPPGTVNCPADWATYQLALSVSGRSRPVVEISATQSSCGGTGITVAGRAQPALADDGAVADIVNQALHLGKH